MKTLLKLILVSKVTFQPLNEIEVPLADDNIPTRQSCDAVVNSYGRALLAFCKTYGLCIVNGRYCHVKDKGNLTFKSATGTNIIDYIYDYSY